MNFGSDGYLYLSTGDGDLKVDPQNDAQRLDSLLGKILRIDVSAGKADETAPKLHVTVAGKQRVLSSKAAVAYASCSERCSVIASARLLLGRGYALAPAGVAQRAGRRGRITLRLTSSCVRALTRALKRKREVSVRVTLRGEDLTGNSPRAVTRTIQVSG
jgi:hypothetical protein